MLLPLVVVLLALPSGLISLISSHSCSAIAVPWCWCLSPHYSFRSFSLAQPLIIQQIIDKVIGQQNFNTLYFLGVLLIGCSVISNILNLIRTFLFTDTTNRIDIATSGNILTHLFKLPLGYLIDAP